MTDTNLIDLFFARSEDAIARTKEQYGRLVRHIIAGILKSTQDIEECENDTYLSAWNAIPPNRPNSLKAYLAIIARNTALKRYEYGLYVFTYIIPMGEYYVTLYAKCTIEEMWTFCQEVLQK